MLVFHSLSLSRRLRNIHERNNDIGQCEYTHCDKQERSDITHRSLLSNSSDKNTYEKRSKSTCERVHGTTDLDILVTFVSTATEKVKHRIHHSIKHTNAESADKCTEKVNINS